MACKQALNILLICVNTIIQNIAFFVKKKIVINICIKKRIKFLLKKKIHSRTQREKAKHSEKNAAYLLHVCELRGS
jgi:hypothetical protein